MKLDSSKNLQIALLIVTTLSGCWASVLDRRTKKPAFCMSKQCIFSSANVLRKMNPEVDPCANFYQFACGNFIRDTFLPDTAPTIDTMGLLQGKVNMQLKRLYDENKMGESPVRTFQLMHEFYSSCLDRKSSNSRGIQPVLDLIKRYGGWPVLSPDTFCVDCKYDWPSIMAQASNDGVHDVELFSLNIMSDFKNTTRRVLSIAAPSYGLRKEFLMKGFTNKKVQTYFIFMVEVAIMFGADKKTAEEKMSKVLNFEYEMAKATIPSEKLRDFKAIYNIYTIADLQKSYPYVQWLEFLRESIGQDIAIDENEPIMNIDPNFFSQLSKILSKTSNETIANYLMWRLVMFSSNYLSDNLHHRKQLFDSSIHGLSSLDHFKNKCATMTTKRMLVASSSLYIRTYFQNETKTEVEEIAKYIRGAFIKLLKQNKWMDEQTREAALIKANRMVGHIAYPLELLNDDIVNEFYKALKFERQNFFSNVLRLNIFNSNVVLSEFRKPVDKSDWKRHSDMTSVNAFYATHENSFIFPAAILQDHFFAVDRPAYMNYAAFGSVLGHEITHGFDDGGRQFDENGNLHNWWDKETSEKFLERSNCFIKQYSNYTDSKTNLKLNGVLTQGENIADNGGTKTAYLAYQQHVNNNDDDEILPGLQKYTANQLFWISYAQTWCSVARREFNERAIMTNVHTISEYRVLGVVQNSKYFENDFSCTNRQNQIESNKCEIW